MKPCPCTPRRKASVLAFVLTLPLLVPFAEAQTPQTLFGSNGFEASGSPSYSLGTIAGQNGWQVVKGLSTDANVENSVYFTTDATDTSGPPAGQALQLNGVGGYVTAEQVVSVTQSAYYDVWVLTPPATSHIGSGGLLPLVLRSSTNKIFLQAKLDTAGHVTMTYINSPTDTTTTVQLTDATYNWSVGTWTQVTLYIDVVNHTFTVYLNGMSHSSGTNIPFSYGSGTDGRTANEALYWYSATGDTTPTYFDRFHITAAQVPMPATYLGSAMTTPAGSSQSTVLTAQAGDTSLTPPSKLLGTRAMVYAGHVTSAPYCFTGFYYPSMRDYSQTHTFSWFRAHHPDWLAYTSNTDPDDVSPVLRSGLAVET